MQFMINHYVLDALCLLRRNNDVVGDIEYILCVILVVDNATDFRVSTKAIILVIIAQRNCLHNHIKFMTIGL